MNHTGYILVDGAGLNLNKSDAQTISGFYAKSLAALNSGKPVYVVNCNMSGAPCAPVCVTAWQEGTNIIATGHVLRVTITNEDSVTVTNLITANRSAKTAAK
jgi:hypothetical protein